jgi:hypothetical protein
LKTVGFRGGVPHLHGARYEQRFIVLEPGLLSD